jgi:hypothetical protein
MSIIKLKNLPKIKLADLLRRRKLTLRQFLNEFGITTYESLVLRCERMGVGAPDEKEFIALNLVAVSNPSEGVVVIEVDVHQFNAEPTLTKLPFTSYVNGDPAQGIVVLEDGDDEKQVAPETSEGHLKTRRKKKDISNPPIV